MNLTDERSLPQKISEDIISLILEENLQPGDKLPNETVLCEKGLFPFDIIYSKRSS